MPKVLILTGDAAETLEVFYPYQRLREEGYDVDIAAPSAKRLQFVVHDFVEGFDTYTEKPAHTWQADVAFADVDPADYVALVIPGGRAPEYIRNDEDAKRIVRHFYGEAKPVAQLCHGPLVAAAAGVLKGRRTSAYPALATDVETAGGTWVDGEAVVDGNVVSGRAWPDHPGWMRAFMAVLREHAPLEPQPA
jgi:protease I